MMNLLWWIVIGFFAGLIARAVLPGADHMGFLATTAVGIIGSVIGGYIGGRVKTPVPGEKFHRTGLLMSVIGAVVLLVVIRLLR